MKSILEVGYHKGEMDFGVSAAIADLSLEQMDEFRIMTIVAIGQAESMWRNSRNREQVGQETKSKL